MKKILPPLIFTMAALAIGGITNAPAAGVPRITKEELKGLLGNSAVVIIDARTTRQWNSSRDKIPGAVRENPNAVSSWGASYPKDKTIVIYCA